MIGLLFLVINGFSSLARVYCARDASPGAFSLADGAPAMQGGLRPGRAIGSMRCCSRWCACDSTFRLNVLRLIIRTARGKSAKRTQILAERKKKIGKIIANSSRLPNAIGSPSHDNAQHRPSTPTPTTTARPQQHRRPLPPPQPQR